MSRDGKLIMFSHKQLLSDATIGYTSKIRCVGNVGFIFFLFNPPNDLKGVQTVQLVRFTRES